MGDFFTTNFRGEEYDAGNKASFQGQLSKSYEAALSVEVQKLADYVGFIYKDSGASLDEAKAVVEAIKAGQFKLEDLQSAAQSKTGPVDGAAINDPDPKVLVNGVSISIKGMLDGLDTETWQDSGKNGQHHTREFYTSSREPEGYDSDWANPPKTNEAPVTENVDLGQFLESQSLGYDQHVDGPAPQIIRFADLFGAVTDDATEDANLVFAFTELPDFVTVDYDAKEIKIDLNSRELDDILKDTTRDFSFKYTVTDEEGVASNESTISFEIKGTADVYKDSDTFDFIKTRSSDMGSSFTETFSLSHDGAFGASVSFSGHADLDGDKESLTVIADGSSETRKGTLSSQGSSEVVADQPYSILISLADLQLEDGKVVVEGSFSQLVAQGSNVHVELDYFYWA